MASLFASFDVWQRAHAVGGFPVAVVKKFNEDRATNLSALSVSLVASVTRCRVRFRSSVALTPSELSTAAIAGRVRCCEIISATVPLPAEACWYSSRAAERRASRELRICDAERSRR